MDCFEAGILMLKELEGESTDKETDALMNHMLGCNKCLKHFMLLKNMVGGINCQIEDESIPKDFEIQVMTKIRNINAITVVRKKVIKYR